MQRVMRMRELEVRDPFERLRTSHLPGTRGLQNTGAQFLRNAERRKESQARIGYRNPVQQLIRRTAPVLREIP